MIASLRKLLRSGSDVTADNPGVLLSNVPKGQCVYAIGDVHGRLDLLRQLVGQIESDMARHPSLACEIVFLGDLVDRGPDSKQVIDFVMGHDWGQAQVRHLIGNHEEVFLRVLDGDLESVRFWLRIGGAETMASYGVPESLIVNGSSMDVLHDFVPRVPRAHIAFLHAMEDMIAIGDYLFVHAGIRPGVPIGRQKPSDLRWIRGEFLNHEGDFGAVVVHGHSITEDVEQYTNRIGIDTGAFASGKLTALALQANQRRILQT